MPIEEGMDAMAKQISATGRTHSVFELAWVVLGGMDRFHVIFESEEQPIYRSKSDHSVWLTQKECMAHFWSAGLHKKYYTEDIIEVNMVETLMDFLPVLLFFQVIVLEW